MKESKPRFREGILEDRYYLMKYPLIKKHLLNNFCNVINYKDINTGRIRIIGKPRIVLKGIEATDILARLNRGVYNIFFDDSDVTYLKNPLGMLYCSGFEKIKHKETFITLSTFRHPQTFKFGSNAHYKFQDILKGLEILKEKLKKAYALSDKGNPADLYSCRFHSFYDDVEKRYYFGFLIYPSGIENINEKGVFKC